MNINNSRFKMNQKPFKMFQNKYIYSFSFIFKEFCNFKNNYKNKSDNYKHLHDFCFFKKKTT